MGFRRSWVQIPPARPIKTLKIPPYTSLDLHSGECRGSDRGALWPESLRYGLPAGRVRVIEGAPLRTIAQHLNTERVPYPRRKGWSSSALQAMLQNPIYQGTYLWNRSEWIKECGGAFFALRRKSSY